MTTLIIGRRRTGQTGTFMADEPARPSRSDIKPAYRRLLCAKCGGEHWHSLTGPYTWTCPCGASFIQNPWVTDDHPIVEPPDYGEGEQQCQAMNPDNNPKNAHFAKEAANASTATARDGLTAPGEMKSMCPVNIVKAPATAQRAMAQASFLL